MPWTLFTSRPILSALLLFHVFFLALLVLLPTKLVLEILDSFSIGGGSTVVYRFGGEAWRAMNSRDPMGRDYWVAGGFIVALSIVLIRTLRTLGLELGLINSTGVAYLFGLLTTFMVFGLFLKASGPMIGPWQYRLTPYGSVFAACVVGVSVMAFVGILRWVF